ncbi:hypothetical protein BDR03DRAFT_1062667, partial [Suillus americanus]
YKLLISGIIPRPIPFVSTISEEGIVNLVPFSWFNMVTSCPPIISFAYNHSAPGHFKDTIANLKTAKDSL